jgi:hypothetical protein
MNKNYSIMAGPLRLMLLCILLTSCIFKAAFSQATVSLMASSSVISVDNSNITGSNATHVMVATPSIAISSTAADGDAAGNMTSSGRIVYTVFHLE